MNAVDCLLCRHQEADEAIERVEVWRSDQWRLTTSVAEHDYTPGFSYLEPIRHIRYIHELDGVEAETLGPALARATAALKEATGAELVYVYVFGGGIPHLHLHLAPHTEGDALNTALVRGELEERKLPNGLTLQLSSEFEPLPRDELLAVSERARLLLSSSES